MTVVDQRTGTVYQSTDDLQPTLTRIANGGDPLSKNDGKRAVSGTSRRTPFFLYIAVFLVATSHFRQNAWEAIVAKLAVVVTGFLLAFLFELYKGWRVVAGKPQLDSGQLWKRFFIVVGVVSAIYILLAVRLAVFAGNPNDLALLFPFYLCFLFSSALPFFWEFRGLRTNESEGDST